MRKLSVNDYHIEIKQEVNYCFDSSDNKYYDKVLDLAGHEDFVKTICLMMKKDGSKKEVALIVPYFTGTDHCALPAERGLFLMLNDLLYLFHLETMDVTKRVKIDAIGSMIAPYSYKQDFILYGEMSIFRIASDLSVKWEFSGRDIFIDFEMKSDRICLYDLEGSCWEINYDGILIR